MGARTARSADRSECNEQEPGCALMRIKTRKQTGNTQLVTTDSSRAGVFLYVCLPGLEKWAYFVK